MLPDVISSVVFFKLIQITSVLFEPNTQYKSPVATGITLVYKARRGEPCASPQSFCAPLPAGLALQAGLQHLSTYPGESKILGQ